MQGRLCNTAAGPGVGPTELPDSRVAELTNHVRLAPVAGTCRDAKFSGARGWDIGAPCTRLTIHMLSIHPR
jgi:hypothetical protein